MIEVEHLIQYALIYTRIKMTKINIPFIYRNTHGQECVHMTERTHVDSQGQTCPHTQIRFEHTVHTDDIKKKSKRTTKPIFLSSKRTATCSVLESAMPGHDKKGLNTHTHTDTHTIQRRSATRLHCCISVCVRRPWQSDRSSHTRTQHKCTVTHVQIQGQDHIHTYTIHTCAHMHIHTVKRKCRNAAKGEHKQTKIKTQTHATS